MNRFLAFAMIMIPVLFVLWVALDISGLIGGIGGFSIFSGLCYLSDGEWPWE